METDCWTKRPLDDFGQFIFDVSELYFKMVIDWWKKRPLDRNGHFGIRNNTLIRLKYVIYILTSTLIELRKPKQYSEL